MRQFCICRPICLKASCGYMSVWKLELSSSTFTLQMPKSNDCMCSALRALDFVNTKGKKERGSFSKHLFNVSKK